MRAPALKIDYVNKKTNYQFHFPISIFIKPRNTREYVKLERILDELIDEVRGNSKHPLAIVMQIIGDNLEQYDHENFPDIGSNITEVEMVKYIMDSQNLRQEDLSDIFGGQANVSRFLRGERQLSKSQISGLKKRFKISADFFVK